MDDKTICIQNCSSCTFRKTDREYPDHCGCPGLGDLKFTPDHGIPDWCPLLKESITFRILPGAKIARKPPKKPNAYDTIWAVIGMFEDLPVTQSNVYRFHEELHNRLPISILRHVHVKAADFKNVSIESSKLGGVIITLNPTPEETHDS